MVATFCHRQLEASILSSRASLIIGVESPRPRPRRPVRYCVLPLPLPTSTSATRLRALQASTRLPSVVAIMFRTTPPPDGITHVWNFSVWVSKRTSVFGLTPDSLYQTTLPTVAMPYGWDLGPLGEGHSRVWPVLGSYRPR